MSADRQHLVEVAVPEFARGVGQPLDGPQDHAAEPVPEEQPERQRRDHRQQHYPCRPARGLSRVMVFLRHRVFVDPFDDGGGVEQLGQGAPVGFPVGGARVGGSLRRFQKSFLTHPQPFGGVTLARFGDDVQFAFDAVLADRRLFPQHVSGRLNGSLRGQGAIDPERGVGEVLHRHDAHVVLVQRCVDGVAQLHKKPHGIPSHRHQNDEDRRDSQDDAVT